MTANVSARAEDLYMDILAIAAANGDFLQPSDGADLLLPEVLIGALAATIATAFVNGFAGELGKGLADKIRKHRFRKGELVEVEAEAFVTELARIMANDGLDPVKEAKAHAEIAATLQDLGLADPISVRIADQVIAAVKRHWRT